MKTKGPLQNSGTFKGETNDANTFSENLRIIEFPYYEPSNRKFLKL